MSCLAMGGIGCLVIIIALFLGGGAIVAKYWDKIQEAVKNPERTAVTVIFNANPNIELVSEDAAKREMTFKFKGDAETYTMNLNEFKDAKDGKISLKNGKGESIEVELAQLATLTGLSSSAPVPAPAPAPAAPQN